MKLDDLIKDLTTPYVYIIGDVNAYTMAGKQQKFGKELMNFCHGEELILPDVKKCPNTTYTYVSEAHSTVSWVDHVMCTHSPHAFVDNISVLYDKIKSDHHPLTVTLDFLHEVNIDKDDHLATHSKNGIKWDMMTDVEMA